MTAKPITFPRTVTANGAVQYVNAETGVKIHAGSHMGKPLYHVTTPALTAVGQALLCKVTTLVTARRWAKAEVAKMREAIAAAHDRALSEDFRRAQATPAPAAPTVDALARMGFAELMKLAKQHNVPGRGDARLEALRAGVRAALEGQGGVPVVPAPRVPGRAAAMPVWRVLGVDPGKATTYVTTDGRWRIVGRPVGTSGNREFNAYDAISGAKVGHTQRRLMDAKRTVREHVETLEKAHTDARLCERARLAGDPQWIDATHGQVLQALAEDARREGERKRAGAGGGPRELSGFGKLALAYQAAR